MEIAQVGADFFHADRHDEVVGHFLQFRERA